MLSEIINIDLHIHSMASKYKDGSIVENSNINNIDILIKNLMEQEINLFAITDHNRFDYKLYEALMKAIKGNKVIKKILPGIEFDVVLEKGYDRCHIIAIFDDVDQDKIKNIETNIDSIKKLTKQEEYYSIDEFELILKAIDCKTILIVHQKQSIDNTNSKTESLSNSCSNPFLFLQTGYIDSLEYNKPRVEGIVKNSLRDINLSYPLITGSDCHTWTAYPFRDAIEKSEINKKTRDFTKLKCLPTFKGLLMAMTSFKTRANRNKNINNHFIKSINCNNKEYKLENGINVIIGDNGAGKSFLLNTICQNRDGKKIYKKLLEKNQLTINYNNESFQKEFITYISQGDIVEKVRNGNLFDERDTNYYNNITSKDLFKTQITNFFDNLKKYIMKNIGKNEGYLILKNKNIEVIPIDRNFYYPIINATINNNEVENDKNRLEELDSIILKLKNELTNHSNYYKEMDINENLLSALNQIKTVQQIIQKNLINKEEDNKVRQIISKNLKNYEIDLKSKKSSKENKDTEIININRDFKSSIISYIRLFNDENAYPTFPGILKGFSIKSNGSYNFTKVAKFNEVDLKSEFYKACFNSNYQTDESLKEIDTRDKFSNALKSYELKDIEDFKVTKLKKFIEEWSAESTFISEQNTDEEVGNTPGEISLVFYKFLINESDKEFNVLCIDQPEDDINPKRINDYLLKYLNSIRDTKQVIIVTHNPLLVVNLDVDNVIFINKINNELNINNGPLEYETENYNILDLIKNHLDGGYDAVEGRLKKYDRE